MSYVGIDIDLMKILFKVPDVRSACLISGMLDDDSTQMIFPVEQRMPGDRQRTLPRFLTVIEQKILYRNMAGQDWGGNIGGLMDELHKMLLAYPMDPRSLFQLEKAAGPADLPCDVGMPEPSGVNIMRSAIPSAPVIPSAPTIPKAPITGAIPSAPPIPSAPSIPSAPRIPSAPSAPPKAGGATAKVWEIADKFFGEDGSQAHDMKSFRKTVVDACVAEGINAGTAATQFGKWKGSKGL